MCTRHLRQINIYSNSLVCLLSTLPRVRAKTAFRPCFRIASHAHFHGCAVHYQQSFTNFKGIRTFLDMLHMEAKNNLIPTYYADLQENLLSALQPKELDAFTKLLQEILKTKSDIEDLEHFIIEASAEKEMVIAATKDKSESMETLHTLEDKFMNLLSLGVGDEVDNMDIILELSAGVGGQEAMLFTLEMFNMYQNYAVWKQWDCQVVEYTTTDIGGIRNATLSIAGQAVGRHFKFESGVHRVQRIPKTERSGRIHTSTMTVAMLPQSKEIEVALNPDDLKIETKRSSGAGGQHVNKTESCVKIVHLHTGISSECQIERSQHRNREIAIKTLAAKLYQRELEDRLAHEKTTRKSQVGTASRSEKVRTYNYAQDRITDHRLGKNYHDVETFMAGREKLDDLVNELLYRENLKAVTEYFNKFQ